MTTKRIQRARSTNFCWLITVIIGLGVSPPSLSAGQASSSCADGVQSTGEKVSPMKLAHLLQEPNGLENAAKLAGHFSVDGELHPINQSDVDSAISDSSLIAVGTISAKSSELMEDGDDIFTKYTMHVNTLLKGSVAANGDVAFYVRGGCIRFANGTSAEITTIAWRYLEVGQRYLVFLYRLPGEDTYSITGGIEGLGKPTSQSGEFEIAADLDKELHHVVSDRAKSMRIADIAAKIKLKH